MPMSLKRYRELLEEIYALYWPRLSLEEKDTLNWIFDSEYDRLRLPHKGSEADRRWEKTALRAVNDARLEMLKTLESWVEDGTVKTRVIIAGSRLIEDPEVVERAINESELEPQIHEVVSGGAPGIDTLGERWAKRNLIPVKRFPADWNKFGKAAGPMRNRQMAQYAHYLIAIPNPLGSKGTDNMIEEARKQGLKVFVLYVKDKPKTKRDRSRKAIIPPDEPGSCD